MIATKMFRFVTKRKNKGTTTKQLPFVKNQNFIERIKSNTKYKSEFHNCMRNVMRLCRWLGLFPVEGLEKTSWDKLKFNLKSFYGIWYVASFLGLLINLTIALTKIIKFGASLSLFTGIFFYSNGVVAFLLFFVMAQNWSTLVKKAAALEAASNIAININTSNKIVVLAYMITVFGLLEHCFAVNYFVKYINGCNPNYSYSDVVTSYFFQKLPYNYSNDIVLLLAQIFLEVTGTQGTFLWSFTDVVNISMSMYLIAHFEKLNKLIFAGKDNKSTNWRKLREQQGILVQLIHLVNDHFSYCVLLSCFSNLYFLCVQLYNNFGAVAWDVVDCDQKGITDVLHSFDHHVYFLFSFVYLMVKTFTLSHMAANVNAVAQEPLSALGEIHPMIYGIEIQRFYRQMNYTVVGVSCVFFYITRGTILKVISSVVTYELMLIQINNRKHTSQLSVFEASSTISINDTMLSLYSNGSFSIW